MSAAETAAVATIRWRVPTNAGRGGGHHADGGGPSLGVARFAAGTCLAVHAGPTGPVPGVGLRPVVCRCHTAVMGHRHGALAHGTVVLLGGRSQIGLETVVRLARGRVVVLAARRSDDLAEEIARVRAAGASEVRAVEFDADDTAVHASLLRKIASDHGTIGIVVVAFGVLGDQGRAERDPAHAVGIVHTDFVAQVSVLTVLASVLRGQGGGEIVVFSSIAGVRVRRANYVYGSAKAGLDGFAIGLADALHGSGVHLLLVRPGFVIGRMTEGMPPVPFLSSTPGEVASAVVEGLQARADRVWVPRSLRFVAMVMHLVPQGIWRRMPR